MWETSEQAPARWDQQFMGWFSITNYLLLLLTRGSGWKGRGLGQDLVLVGHEGRKAKGLDVVGWVWKFKGRNLSPPKLN